MEHNLLHTFSDCYRFEYIHFNKGLLDNIIDAVYVILLERSNRNKGVFEQINEYKLSKNNYIQINKGYSPDFQNICKKSLIKSRTHRGPVVGGRGESTGDLIEGKANYDLLDSNYNIWLHAKEKNYNNILVLEDDFIFDNNIKDKGILKDLDNFINKNDFDIYLLGFVTSTIFHPYLSIKHRKMINIPQTKLLNPLRMKGAAWTGATAVILSKHVRDDLIYNYENNIEWIKENGGHVDIIYGRYNVYSYYKPLCYQLLPLTENMENWWWSGTIFQDIFLKAIKSLKLDKKYDGHHISKGYNIMVTITHIISILVYLLIIYLIYNLYCMCKK